MVLGSPYFSYSIPSVKENCRYVAPHVIGEERIFLFKVNGLIERSTGLLCQCRTVRVDISGQLFKACITYRTWPWQWAIYRPYVHIPPCTIFPVL